MEKLSVKTHKRNDMVDITAEVSAAVSNSGLRDGLVVVHVPHTTAGVTINENADPDVVGDILLTLAELAPPNRPGYRHSEGNSDAHVKSSMIGSSVTVLVEDGRLCLGTWQGIYFCEFDGPRNRSVWIKAV